MIHGSLLGADDELTPETSPIDLLDRLSRGDVNTLFCGRSGLAFEASIESGSLTNTVQTLDRSSEPEVVTIKSKKVVGVGNVGSVPGTATYTLYAPGSGQVKFRSINYGKHKGFGIR